MLKPPLYRERKALFRSDGVLQSAPVILQPTQTAKRQPATNTVRRRRISASDFRRGTIRKGDLLRQSEPGKLSAIGNRFRSGSTDL
ncbi:NGFI-A-binding protein 2 isoform X1 [Lates japonicus]|uniref:NGFI-A-binding protein 2 isoform X1 n=1 Tax=Lates japonicus TaxID=270547 RepID=A0AAD3N2X8_LATJO|nr:NGFI-A-binding protein 2 isoform X1 [Lates japonicus]